ncbi:hypothetical protein [Paraburkholderia sp. J8-2]|uniref:hypothetical protein n=1 Tax=Paraburkholderia sp. J8-2 TaxID=2805440 RepID=UPI0039EFB95C
MKNARHFIALAAVLPAIFSTPSMAAACMEGAAVGGVTGHVAGKHGTAGAAAGCAVGHHEATKKQKEKAASHAAESQPASQ